jgi:hypothetical protein
MDIYRRPRHSPGLTMPFSRYRSIQHCTFGGTTVETDIFAQITTSEFSPVLKVATVLGGIIALFVAMRVGQVLIKLFFGVIGLAILGGAVWWFFLRH